MRFAHWLVSLFVAAALRQPAGSQGYAQPPRVPVRPGRTGPRAKTTAAHIQRRSRKARAVAREKARQRGRR